MVEHRGGGPRFRTLRDIFADPVCFMFEKETGSLISVFPRDERPRFQSILIQVSFRVRQVGLASSILWPPPRVGGASWGGRSRCADAGLYDFERNVHPT